MQVFFLPQAQPVLGGYLAVLGTGGTIAGRAVTETVSSTLNDHIGYVAGEVGIDQLVGDLASLVRTSWEEPLQVRCQQVAQIDSKDADWDFWWGLAGAACKALTQPECQGVVITHGTDTLEESAWFLQCVLGSLVASKPVVLTCAMRPASALVPDGPQNLVDALTLAAYPGACGVQVCVGGESWSARSVQKVHPYRVNAFNGADVGPVAYVEAGQVRPVVTQALDLADDSNGQTYQHAHHCLQNIVRYSSQPPQQPWVEMVLHTAATSPKLIDSLHAAGVQGLVVQTTGNGTINQQWEQQLQVLMHQGWPVWGATRCQSGFLVGTPEDGHGEIVDTQYGSPAHVSKRNLSPARGMTPGGLPFVPGLSGVKTRISLMLWLMQPSG